MAADHSARGSMKTGVKPETVCELQDTNDHRQVERKWRLPISVGKLSALEGRLINLPSHDGSRGRFVMSNGRTRTGHTLNTSVARALDTIWRRLKCQFLAASHAVAFCWRPCPVQNALGSDAIAFVHARHFIFDLGGAGPRTELKHIIKCRKRNQMGFP